MLFIFIALCLGHDLTQHRCLTNVCWTSWNWSSAYVQNKQSWRSVSKWCLYGSPEPSCTRVQQALRPHLEDLLLARPCLALQGALSAATSWRATLVCMPGLLRASSSRGHVVGNILSGDLPLGEMTGNHSAHCRVSKGVLSCRERQNK